LQKKWNNLSGRPLSSSDWLYEHHIAKLPERTNFIKNLFSNFKPKRIVDLGCGTGLWLELINNTIDFDCEFIGIDSDKLALEEAQKRSVKWNKKVTYIESDFMNIQDLPEADLYLAFNVFSYIKSPSYFIDGIKDKLSQNGKLVIRQYDGAAIRFGPMSHELRINIENVLFNSVNYSQSFKHYDLDRVFEAIENSNFEHKEINFELFKRNSPYPQDFYKYYSNTIKWTINYLNENMSKELQHWYDKHLIESNSSYFYEVDLISILSH